jgi:hypothetical protein
MKSGLLLSYIVSLFGGLCVLPSRVVGERPGRADVYEKMNCFSQYFYVLCVIPEGLLFYGKYCKDPDANIAERQARDVEQHISNLSALNEAVRDANSFLGKHVLCRIGDITGVGEVR